MKKTEIFHYLIITLATLIAFAIGIFFPVDITNTIIYEVTALDTLGLDPVAYDINNLGQIVGTFKTNKGTEHGFFWDPTTGMQSLTPRGQVNSHALNINNLGQVASNVGYRWNKYSDEYRQGFLWDKTNCFPQRMECKTSITSSIATHPGTLTALMVSMRRVGSLATVRSRVKLVLSC